MQPPLQFYTTVHEKIGALGAQQSQEIGTVLSSIAMEVLHGISATSLCSISHSSAQTNVFSPISFSVRPPALVASLVATSSSLVASVPPSLALKYDEFVRKGETVASSSSDASSLIDFVGSNPVAILAGVAAVAVPLIAFRASSAQSFGSVSAAAAFAKLSDPEQSAQLLDIRAPEDIRAVGTPNLKSLRKRAVQVAYSADDKSFVGKVLAKFRNAENTTLFVLDR